MSEIAGSLVIHAFSYLAVPDFSADCAADLFRPAQNHLMAAVVDGGFLFLLCVVESLLPVAGGLFDAPGLFACRIDGPVRAEPRQGRPARPFNPAAIQQFAPALGIRDCNGRDGSLWRNGA